MWVKLIWLTCKFNSLLILSELCWKYCLLVLNSNLSFPVTIRCGTATSENCTYFESQGTEIGSCAATICRSHNNVCQLRLDFNNFILGGPEAGTVTTTKLLNGLPAQSVNAIPARAATQCNVDSFSVTRPTGRAPAVICGVNTGEHCNKTYLFSTKH